MLPAIARNYLRLRGVPRADVLAGTSAGFNSGNRPGNKSPNDFQMVCVESSATVCCWLPLAAWLLSDLLILVGLRRYEWQHQYEWFAVTAA